MTIQNSVLQNTGGYFICNCMYLFILTLCYFSRGHTVRAVCESFHLAKDAGFKVVAHMMPDLPNVGMERDVEQFIVSTSWIIFILQHSSLAPNTM